MDKKILELHKQGLSNRQIAISLGHKHHHGVNSVIKESGLKPNGIRRHKKLKIKDGEGLCTKCDTWKPLKSFKTNRNGSKHKYRLTFCNKCGWKQRNNYLNNTPDAYLKNRFNTLRQHAKRRNIEFTLTLEDVLFLSEKQKGLCGYTHEKMSLVIGQGLIDDTLSFDRWDNSKGYIVGNVILCTKQANVCKSNLSLEKFKEWMPKLYANGECVIRMWKEESIEVIDVGNGVEF